MSATGKKKRRRKRRKKKADILFRWDEHATYIVDLNKKEKGTFIYYVTEHLRISGIYWGLTALSMLRQLNRMPLDDIFEFTMQCYNPSIGAFSGNVGHDPNLLYTLSSVQILMLIGRLQDPKVDLDAIAKYVSSLQDLETGSFRGDEWGEVDTRFAYAAASVCSLIGRPGAIDIQKAADWVLKCQNFDGGFGVCPGAESHGGQIFCCVGLLSMAGRLREIDQDRLGWWLGERQCPNGGLNGRPEKLPDVCYSWWVLSSLKMMNREHWIDKKALVKFILKCQDKDGGISDRPGDMVDVFHTLFGIGGLSMLGAVEGLRPIDPVYCMPVHVLKEAGIQTPSTQVYDEKRDAELALKALALHPVPIPTPSAELADAAAEEGEGEGEVVAEAPKAPKAE